MAERFVLSEEAVTQTVGVITGLIERVDRIGTTEGRMDGDLGAVYDAVADGEEKLETLKTELKELFQATVTYLNDMVDEVRERDKVAVQQIEMIQ